MRKFHVILLFGACLSGKVQPASAFEHPLIFGINPIWGVWLKREPAEFDPLMFDAIASASATCVRIGIGWCDVEEERGTYDWSQFDAWINLAAERHLEIVGLMCVPPLWASDATGEKVMHQYPPKQEFMEDYVRFWRALVNRYKDRISRWELFNEPNNLGWHKPGYADDYVPCLVAAAKTLREVDPQGRISVGGLDGCDVRYLERIYELGGGEYFDAVAVHPYSSEGIDAAGLYTLHRVLVDHGHAERPLWITEYGWVVRNEEVHADNIRRAFRVLLRDDFSFVELATFHTICDFGPDPGQRYGLMKMDLTPRRGYEVFREVASDPEAFAASQPPLEVPPVQAEFGGGKFEGQSLDPWVLLGNSDGILKSPVNGVQAFEGNRCAGAFAAWDLKNGTYLQRVRVQPNTRYRIAAHVHTSQRGGKDENCRWRLGLDPCGEADPVAIHVIWSEWATSPGKWSEVASPKVEPASDVLTVFLEHRQSWALEWNQMLIDNVRLEAVEGEEE